MSGKSDATNSGPLLEDRLVLGVQILVVAGFPGTAIFVETSHISLEKSEEEDEENENSDHSDVEILLGEGGSKSHIFKFNQNIKIGEEDPMESSAHLPLLPDPCNDRQMKAIVPPPHKAVSTEMLYKAGIGTAQN